MAKQPRKTTKLTDFLPMQRKLRDYEKALHEMVTYIESYLPEGWQKEEWFKQAKQVIKKHSKQSNPL